jgi:hypothetical protein
LVVARGQLFGLAVERKAATSSALRYHLAFSVATFA